MVRKSAFDDFMTAVRILGLLLLLGASARSAESEPFSDGGSPAITEPNGSDRPSVDRSKPAAGPSFPLSPRGHPAHEPSLGKGGGHAGLPTSLASVGSSLAVVLGLFLVVAWLLRKGTPGDCPVLPKEAVEVLGRAPLTARQQVHLIRLGSKLVLVCVTPGGVEALSEVADPAEVDHLAGLCRQSLPNSSTAAFRQVIQQFTGGSTPEATHA